MASIPVRLEWWPVVQGDRMEPVHFYARAAGQPLDIQRVAMQWRDRSGRIVVDWASDDEGISLIDGPGGHFQVGPMDIELPAGRYAYDIQIDSDLLGRKTFFAGVVPVVGQITAGAA